jgi:hypothetical protein
MAAIDIGTGAGSDLGSDWGAGYTVIDLANPANDTGIINSMEFWYRTTGVGVKCGAFSNDGSNKFTPRDYETIGGVTAGSKQTFNGLNCTVVTADVIGQYQSGGNLSCSSVGGTSLSYKTGDQFGAGQQTYTPAAGWRMAVYGTGTTSVGWANIAKVNGATATDLAKIRGVAVADIAKRRGAAV